MLEVTYPFFLGLGHWNLLVGEACSSWTPIQNGSWYSSNRFLMVLQSQIEDSYAGEPFRLAGISGELEVRLRGHYRIDKVSYEVKIRIIRMPCISYLFSFLLSKAELRSLIRDMGLKMHQTYRTSSFATFATKHRFGTSLLQKVKKHFGSSQGRCVIMLWV